MLCSADSLFLHTSSPLRLTLPAICGYSHFVCRKRERDRQRPKERRTTVSVTGAGLSAAAATAFLTELHYDCKTGEVCNRILGVFWKQFIYCIHVCPCQQWPPSHWHRWNPSCKQKRRSVSLCFCFCFCWVRCSNQTSGIGTTVGVDETVYTTQGMHPSQGYFFFRELKSGQLESKANATYMYVLAAILTP